VVMLPVRREAGWALAQGDGEDTPRPTSGRGQADRYRVK
jgi:hypothetical protein